MGMPCGTLLRRWMQAAVASCACLLHTSFVLAALEGVLPLACCRRCSWGRTCLGQGRWECWCLAQLLRGRRSA